MNGVEGLEALDELIAAARGLSKDGVARVAERAAPAVERALRSRVARGVDVDGKKFAPKVDGSRALVGAEKDVTCTAEGATLKLRVGGHAAWHQRSKGESPSRPRRKLIPTGIGDTPEEVFEELRRALAEVVSESLAGSK